MGMYSSDVDDVIVSTASTVRQVMQCLDQSMRGIALVADQDRRLLATITDGDLRRALLAGVGLDAPVNDLLALGRSGDYTKPVTAPLNSSDDELIAIMNQKRVRQLPLLDHQGKLAGIVNFRELAPLQNGSLRAVIMAGGKGTRLRPLTVETPKPMLPVGDKPLIERTIERLSSAGFDQVNISINYKSERIREYFKDGGEFGVDLNYLQEDQPLGTAGALSMLEDADSPVLVINGDVLTDVNFQAMLEYHLENRAAITVGTRKYDMAVPYGVVQSDGAQVTALNEKPKLEMFVNAGIYVLEPWVTREVPRGIYSDMTSLIQSLLDQGKTVANFPIHEYWIDIGNHDDYRRAQDDHSNGRVGK